jgi:predicted amidohydrolase
MKICAAQIKPFKADIPANITRHKKMIEVAISNDADMIIFPELSITGYEPGLAKELATVKDDQRLDEFQIISDNKEITICIGMPIQSDSGILIGLIIFRPHTPRGLYCKQYLHTDELPYFIPGTEQVYLGEQNEIALSICYELSVPEHSAMAAHNGAKIYLSSVAKTADGVAKAVQSLAGISKQYAMISIMCNCTGHCDNFDAAGKTSAWNNRGELIGQLDDLHEGILLVDTNTEKIIIKML